MITKDYVYAFKCPWTGAVVYIGKSVNPAQRIGQHYASYIDIGKYLKCLYSLGKPAIFVILEETKGSAKQLETNYIKLYSMFGQANHNRSENQDKHRPSRIWGYTKRVDFHPDVIQRKKDLFTIISNSFPRWANDYYNWYSVYALERIINYINNPI